MNLLGGRRCVYPWCLLFTGGEKDISDCHLDLFCKLKALLMLLTRFSCCIIVTSAVWHVYSLPPPIFFLNIILNVTLAVWTVAPGRFLYSDFCDFMAAPQGPGAISVKFILLTENTIPYL